MNWFGWWPKKRHLTDDGHELDDTKEKVKDHESRIATLEELYGISGGVKPYSGDERRKTPRIS